MNGNSRKKVLIDCDPGTDDVMAILSVLAHPEKIEVLGITTVAGNNTIGKVTKNICNVLSFLKRSDIKIAKGADCGLVYPVEPQSVHGKTGLDGFTFPKSTIKPVDIDAVEFLHQKIVASTSKVTILSLAPLTNIALLIKAHPEVKKKIDQIIMMGGSMFSGNILPRSEFNIFADPHAAKIVPSSGINIVMCPLEACKDGYLTMQDIKELNKKDRIHTIVYGLLKYYAEFYRRRNMKHIILYDSATIMYLLHPEIYEGYSCTCDIVLEDNQTRGMTIIDPALRSNVKVLVKGNPTLFKKYLLQDIKLLKKKKKNDE